jgi:2-dehydro-3-deoxygalactonokinase
MQPFCAAVDWGTSSFRVWLIDRAGKAIAGRRSNEGMSTLTSDGYQAVLESHLAALGAAPSLPVVICGMAGSRQGWVEAPYIDVPARLGDIAAAAVHVPGTTRDIRIVPGLAQRDPKSPDVMRGEETQLLGAFGDETGDRLACMPGTHSKWVRVEGGLVTAFTTYMTGELFAAIRGHTILAHAIADEAPDEGAFRNAVGEALENSQALTAQLFSIRASQLLGFARAQASHSAISGLLIGMEIAAAKKAGIAGKVDLIAGGPVAERYATALGMAGISFVRRDADDCVIAGLATVAMTAFAASAQRKIV